MYPISAEVKALFDAEQRQVLRITGTDRNGTDILITDENVRLNGFNIDRYACNGQKLEVGTAIASEMTLKLDNSTGQYNSVVFEGTELFVEVGIGDNTATSGAQTNTLIVPATSARFGYKWKCEVTDNQSQTSASTNVVSISDRNDATFAILKQPACVNVSENELVLLNIEAAGVDLVYRWQRIKYYYSSHWLDCADFPEYSGSDTNTLSFVASGSLATDEYHYRCIVTDNANNSITSDDAIVKTYVSYTPVIHKNPSSVSMNIGDVAVFTVDGNGNDLTYQWLYSTDDGNTWHDVDDRSTFTYIPCGYFIPDQQPRRLSTITIKAMDRMRTLDRMQPTPVPWTTDTDAVMTDDNGTQIDFNAYVAFPTTIQNLVNQVCVHCDVTLATDLSVFPNYDYQLLKMPLIQQQFTYRNIIQWCAGFMGTNAWFDWNGQLRFSWYDNATGYVTDAANRFSSDLFEDDIEITGVQYKNAEGAVIFAGSPDYALDFSDNLMMANVIGEVLPTLNTALSGFVYRPMSAEVINAPYLWPMDVVTFEDKDGNEHATVLTNVNFGINGATVLESLGETKQANDYTNPTLTPVEQAKLISEAINHTDKLDASLDQQGIFNRLTNYGEAQGIYMMNGKLYINMSYARSGTLVLGGLDNQNGLLQVLNVNGETVARMDNRGAEINGSIISKYSDSYNTYEMGLSNGELSLSKNNSDIAVFRGTTDNNGTLQIRGIYKLEFGIDGVISSEGFTDSIMIQEGQILAKGARLTLGCDSLYVKDPTAANTSYLQGATGQLTIGGYTLVIRNGIITNFY